MLTKTLEIGVIEVLQDRRMQVREDTVITEDGTELSRTYTRYVLNPGDDVTDKPQVIKDIAGVLWTTPVIDAWKVIEAKTRELPGV
jgi:hypothetical protein